MASSSSSSNTTTGATSVADDTAAGLRSQERFQDADEIEAFLSASNFTRPSAKLHLENLILKLRKEGKALQRVEDSTAKAANANNDNTFNSKEEQDSSNANMELEEVDGPSPSPTITTATPSVSVAATTTSTLPPPKKYHSFPSILFDAGKYNSPIVTVYLPLPGIGQHDPTKISCNFTSSSVDVIVSDYQNKSYRLLNNNLEKDIDVSQSKYIVKSNKIIVKLGKIKGEYGSYDTWTQLTSKKDKKARDEAARKDSSNPAAGIMDLMKDMYDEGDENMKKMIGETMYKQRMGQLNNNKDDMMGGFGGMGDMMDM